MFRDYINRYGVLEDVEAMIPRCASQSNSKRNKIRPNILVITPAPESNIWQYNLSLSIYEGENNKIELLNSQ